MTYEGHHFVTLSLETLRLCIVELFLPASSLELFPLNFGQFLLIILDTLATLLDILATLWNHTHCGYIVIHAIAVILVIIEINSTGVWRLLVVIITANGNSFNYANGTERIQRAPLH